jgi:competence protein ComFB
MAKKTNKTSHVMDLLTNGASGDSAPASEPAVPSQDTAAGQEKKTDVQSHSVTPKKVTVVDEGSRNDRVSQEILNNLSQELKAETKQEATPDMSTQTSSETSNRTMSPDEIAAAFAAAQQPAVEPPSAPAPETSSRTMSADEIAAAFAAAQQPAAEASPSPAPEAVPAPETSNRTMSADEIAAAFAAAQQPAAEASPSPAPEAVPAPQPAETTSAPADTPTKITPQMVIPKSQISSNLTNDQYHFVNVMEQLILRQDIDNFLEQYNVCKCRRCVSDVCALALSGLPSKYVVTSKDSLSPILSYYESKYRIYMLTELIKACNKVRESPRHKK